MFVLARLLALGLALPSRVVHHSGAGPAHPPCGEKLASPPAGLTTASSPAVASSPLTLQLLEDVERALTDVRRIDELVARFEYSGSVEIPGESQSFQGQGAVKRFLTALLHDHEVGYARLEHDASGGAVAISLSDSTGRPRTLRLHPVTRGIKVAGATLISELTVQEHGDAETLVPLFGGPVALHGTDAAGPKWETYDGRVRQRIWQVRALCRAALLARWLLVHCQSPDPNAQA